MGPRRVAALAALAALAAGCDADRQEPGIAREPAAVDSAAPLVAGPKACDLVTVAELEDIVGVDLDDGRTTNDYAGDSKCEWDLPGDAQRGVTISLRLLDDLALYRNVPGGVDAPNVGDDAIWNATYGQLAVRRGGRVVSIALLIDAPQREDAEAIARVALERLGG